MKTIPTALKGCGVKTGSATETKYPVGQKFRRNRAPSSTLARFSRYKDFYLLKLGKASLHRYPVGQKFCRNPTSKFLFYEENGFKKYSYISIVLYVYLMSLYFQFCVLHFLSKIGNLNMTPKFGEEKFFWENWRE